MAVVRIVQLAKNMTTDNITSFCIHVIGYILETHTEVTHVIPIPINMQLKTNDELAIDWK